MKSLPCFTSHYSIGKSVLTLEKPKDKKENGPDSIIDLCSKNKIKDVFLFDTSMAGYLEGAENCNSAGLNFHFGLKTNVSQNLNDKNEESFDKTSKIIVLVKNNAGYKDLIKIYTKAATEGFYYEPRIDWKSLNELWTDNLLLAIPFYDGFIFENSLKFCFCVPEFIKMKPVFFVEDHDLPFNDIVKEKTINYCKENKFDYLPVHSILYNKKQDYEIFLTFRCISKRTTLSKPNIEHHYLDSFSLESYLEKLN